MYFLTEYITLTAKATGGITVHPIVEVRLVASSGGGMLQVVPVVMVLKAQENISTYVIENIKKSDRLSAE